MPNSSLSPLVSGDGDEVGVSFIVHHLFETCFQIAAVLSVSRQQPTLVKCWKMASFFEKLILGIDLMLLYYDTYMKL